jgi:hypothetical protein
MDNSEYDPDFVVAFTHAEDDELASTDAEPTIGEGGCFALTVLIVIVVIVAALAFSCS